MAPATEAGHLLCTLPFAEPTPLLEQLQKKHPGLKITFRNLAEVKWGNNQVEDDAFEDITILATLATLPSGAKSAPNLKFVQVFMAGTNHLEKNPTYKDSSIQFANCSGVQAPNIAEWVIMTLLVGSRHYNLLHEAQQRHEWIKGQNPNSVFFRSSDSINKRIAILGYGSIGRQVAKIAKAMSIDVIAYTSRPRDTPESRKDNGFTVPGTGDPDGSIPSAWYSGGGKKDLQNFLSRDIDYLVISLPLTDKTKHLLGREEFEILAKKNAYVINIARGEVLVQDELVSALKAFETSGGKEGLRGAAVDVTDPEPLPADSPLWDAPNIIITPHISGLGRDYVQRCFQILDENISRLGQGKKLLNVVEGARG